MPDPVKLGLLIGALVGVVAVCFYGILLLRRWFLKSDEDEVREEADSLYTTAELERMREDGLVDGEEYERLKQEVYEASKRRAEREKKRRGERGGGGLLH